MAYLQNNAHNMQQPCPPQAPYDPHGNYGGEPMRSMPNMQTAPLQYPYQAPMPQAVPNATPQFQPMQEGPPPVTESDYIPGFLAANIGRNVRAEFIIGTNQFMDKSGIITDVGVNYFVLMDTISRNYVMCDLYSVKFVTLL